MSVVLGRRVADAIPPNWARRVRLAFPTDWTVERAWRAPRGDGRGPYYIIWDPGTGVYGEDYAVLPADANGVIMTAGRVRTHHPIDIAQYALHLHDAWLDAGDAATRDRFLAHARWLRDHQDAEGAYRFGFPWEKYGAPAGWRSAMAQGEAISVLLRAADAAPGEGFDDAAERAAAPFRRSIAAGGVTYRRRGDVFFEEAAVEPSAHILNGGIFALWGLWDLGRAGGPSWCGTLADDALATLERRIGIYDSGAWSYYSALATPQRRRAVATLKYHAFHIAQLRVLDLMASRTFGAVADRWAAYQRRAASRAAVVIEEVRGLPARFITHADTVPGGARALF